jgi:hypothetical protein
MKAIDALLNYLDNVFTVRIFSFGMLRLLWTYKHIPIMRDFTKPREFGAFMSRGIGINRKTGLPVKLKVPIPVAIVLGTTTNKQVVTNILLHELGHYEDREAMKKTETQELEVRAWEKALELSKKYNLYLDPKAAQAALNSYKVSSVKLKSLEDLVLPALDKKKKGVV